MFDSFAEASLIGKAKDNGIIGFQFINLRNYTHDRHRTVDDSPYGGGAGMVMKPAPVKEMFKDIGDSHKIFLTPQGSPFGQNDAARLSALKKPLLLFCGRYEGLDERAVSLFDEQLSIGDFVLNGGEVAAMAVIEAVARLLPGVIGNSDSTVEESFSKGLLEYPQYTRPEIFDGRRVPDVLLSGNHKKIEQWRKGQSLLRTYLVRPDLFEKFNMTSEDKALFEGALAEYKTDEQT
jgi:tRNA (guanine37-N1)-methyltransferase